MLVSLSLGPQAAVVVPHPEEVIRDFFNGVEYSLPKLDSPRHQQTDVRPNRCYRC